MQLDAYTKSELARKIGKHINTINQWDKTRKLVQVHIHTRGKDKDGNEKRQVRWLDRETSNSIQYKMINQAIQDGIL